MSENGYSILENINFESLKSLDGNLDITNSDAASVILNFNSLERIGFSRILISEINASLISFPNLSDLSALIIEGNPLLTSVNFPKAFQEGITAEEDESVIRITNNPLLEEISLEGVTSMPFVNITNNAVLTSVSASKLTTLLELSIESDIEITALNLASVTNFESITISDIATAQIDLLLAQLVTNIPTTNTFSRSVALSGATSAQSIDNQELLEARNVTVTFN